MKISRVLGFRQVQKLSEGPYGTSAGTADAFDSTIVALESDDGLVGWGEMAPLGAFYSPAFAAGARAGLPILAEPIVGATLTHPHQIFRMLNHTVQGHPYIKSAVDIAAWDLYAQAANLPLCDALGGRYGDSVALYRPIPAHVPVAVANQYTNQGYRRLQIKVGGDPHDDARRLRQIREAVGDQVTLFADANGAWTTSQARTFLRAIGDLEITIEQPCATLQECAAIRHHCPHPLILDESIDSLESLLRASRMNFADGVTLKLSRLGGLTPAILLRNVALGLNVPTTIEDTGGSTINTAAIVQASLSTPEGLRIHTCDFENWTTTSNASGMPPPQDGSLSAPHEPGLGVVVDRAALEPPFLDAPDARKGEPELAARVDDHPPTDS